MEKHELELAGCLRRLFRNRYLIRTRNEKWFQTFIEHRKRIQEIVAAFGATLEINEPLGLIYLKPTSEELEEKLSYRLSKAQSLSPYASALILHLRWQRLQFYLKPTGNDTPMISTLEMREFLSQFSSAKVDAQFERQFRNSIKELSELQVILEMGSESGFYEITPLCDLLLPADKINDLRSRAQVYFAKIKREDENVSELTLDKEI